jgi:hypothetical protein
LLGADGLPPPHAAAIDNANTPTITKQCVRIVNA